MNKRKTFSDAAEKQERAMSLREWMILLESQGELQKIKAKVDWNLEIGSICRRALTEGQPALLFENIKDYEKGRCAKLFTGGVGTRARYALALSLPRDTSFKTMVKTARQRLENPLTPRVVSTGPVKENILKGKKIDLFEFPVPYWNELDGGRYINTAATVITKDPETGRLNAGTYRGMIVDKDAIGVLMVMTANWGKAFMKYQAAGKPMPVAIVYGFDPLLLITASSSMPPGMPSKYEIVGGLRQAPIELVKAETSDLLVPADAEIVVEGYISTDPKDVKMEGPFGEYTGKAGGLKSPKPYVKVTAITHRNGPIFRGLLEGNSPGHLTEDPYLTNITTSAVAWYILDHNGVPGIRDVWCPIEIAGPDEFRVSIKKAYRGHAKQVAFGIWGSNLYGWQGKYVYVVDDDIDVHDWGAVQWAVNFRANPAMGAISVHPECAGSALDPSVPLKKRNLSLYGMGYAARVLIDATVNWELDLEEQFGGRRESPWVTILPPNQKNLIDRRWKEYGFK